MPCQPNRGPVCSATFQPNSDNLPATDCLPRKDSWRWQTSNSEYGKFYVFVNREVSKNREAHKDCFKKVENLADELKLAKAQLEKLMISCGRSFSRPEGDRAMSCSSTARSPSQGRCECLTKPGPPTESMYVTEHMNQYNGALRHDPQPLMDHIKEEHPQLVKRVAPKLPTSAIRRVIDSPDNADFDEDAGCCPGKMGCGLGSRWKSRSGSLSPGDRSSPRRGDSAAYAGKRKMQWRQSPPQKKAKGAKSEAASDLKHTAAGGINLPPSQRYNFYRQYGYAGQGAKTSKGWHSVKTPWLHTGVPYG
ncbi:uncharacterized protein [Physcomitrium patens]|uniref:Uncharacterized protein n=2 Tax=Physcomitrium patens TaxID=3218 RepID=A0A7I4C4K5_PHYPA|nr:uncharacterized protein LOC112273463 isoform X2 [Physcomitrium patens]|eukprot:XP_024358064.1 uncharacterized protein LOC112273463 isoform X2 [Physcomitrella patens]